MYIEDVTQVKGRTPAQQMEAKRTREYQFGIEPKRQRILEPRSLSVMEEMCMFYNSMS